MGNGTSFTLKVRMDYFICNYTPYINASISHIDKDPYNCQRENLWQRIKDRGTPQYRNTVFLGVIETPTRLKNKYGDNKRYELLQQETYGGVQTLQDDGNNPLELAERYDMLIRNKLGNEARANFLLEPLPHK